MDQTPNLKLPYIAPSQAQKHVTHNEAIRALDALVQLSVIGTVQTDPPAEPQEGDRYIVGSAATGPWSGKANLLAAFQDGAWAFFVPQEGWQAWIMEERKLVVFDQGGWNELKAGTNPVASVGINTIADETNLLSLKSPASLFDHRDGSHQLKINKADDSKAASLLFQSNYRGRAEMGTMWGRDFRIKTSVDGDHWQDVMIADSATGVARFPAGIVNAATGRRQSSLVFLPPAVIETSVFQMDRTGGTTAKLASVSADILTFSTNAAPLFFGAAMRGLSMVRLWNVTRSPAQSAWAKLDTALNALQVSNADHVKQWSAGDTIQIGDPVRGDIAIDISPLMQNNFGSAFQQDGVLFRVKAAGDITLACNDPSPVSSSNLVYFSVDEQHSFSVVGIYG